MPTPRKDETKEKYIARCARSDKMKSEFPDQKQRLAVCYSNWDRTNEAVSGLTFKQYLLLENQVHVYSKDKESNKYKLLKSF